MNALDVEIDRCKRAILRRQATIDGQRWEVQTPKEWALIERQERAEAWLVILLRKRGREADVQLAEAIGMSAWP